MTKKIFKYISVIIICLSFSCSEKLEIEPKQEVDDNTVFNTVNMLENAVTGIYDAIQSTSIYGANSISLVDLRTQHLNFTGSWIAHREVSIKAITTSNTAIRDLWIESYACINASNRILKAVEEGIDDPLFSTVKDRVAGEAYFIRALMYFELIRNFAKPYTSSNLNKDGVPLVLEPTFGLDDALEKPTRETIANVYAQIISDFKNAYELLPATAVGGGRANKYCASAYLARTYSYMSNIEKVIEWTEELVTLSVYALDDDPASTFGENFTAEMIFGIANTSTDNVATHLRWIYSPYNRAAVSVPASTLALYDAEDTRRNVFFDLNGKTWLNKYIEDKDNIPLMRLADIYLVRAEALVSLVSPTPAQLTEALNLLNKIRKRAGIANYSGLTQNELLEKIKEETIKEFIGEGHIFFDLIRWKEDVGYSNDLPDFIVWDDFRNVYPIPQRERDVNGNLDQNDGY